MTLGWKDEAAASLTNSLWDKATQTVLFHKTCLNQSLEEEYYDSHYIFFSFQFDADFNPNPH